MVFYKCLLMIIIVIKAINTKNQIFITLKSIDTHLIFCDDIINFFGTTNISIYKLLEDEKVDIRQRLIKKKTYNNICENGIYFSTKTEYEKFLIEFDKFPKNLHNLFRKSNINSIEIISNYQDDDINEVSDFSNMFQDCLQLTSINLSHYNFCNVGKFNNMFSGCKNLEFFALPKNLSLDCIDTNNVDFTEMFSDCSSLTSIDFSGITFNGIGKINNIFFNCENIQSIKLKGNLNFQIPKTTVYYVLFGKQICINTTILENLHIDIFPKENSLKK